MRFNQTRVHLALQLLWKSAQPEKRHLVQGVFWLVLAAGAEMVGPVLGKKWIDNHLLIRHFDLGPLTFTLVSMVLLGWIASVLRYLQLVRLSGLAMRSVRRLRAQTFGHVLSLPISFFDRAITGQLVSRITNDTEAVKSLYIQVLFVILDSGIILCAALVAMTWLDWHLMLYVASMIPAVVTIVWLYQRLSASAVSQSRHFRSEINAQMAESLGGMPVLQASNAVPLFKSLFTKTNQSHYQARIKAQNANAWLLRPAIDLLNILLLMLVIFSFSKRPLNGIEIGLLYAFVSYIGRIIDPLIQITMQFSQLQQSVVAASRLNGLLQEASTTPSHTNHVISKGAISISQLNFGYEPNQPVLKNISLEIPPGTFLGIAGRTGSGKSTFLNLLLKFYSSQSGSLMIDGIPIEAFEDTAFRAQIGLVPQDPFLVAETLRENIAMGRELSDSEIETAAQAAQVHRFIIGLENGYETKVGEGGSRLSTGQKQLIAIARALAGKPKILLLDEATSHIDSETAQAIQIALRELQGKVTVIAIAHRLSTLRSANPILILNQGRIAESGTHEELINQDEGIYRKLYLLQGVEE